VRGVDWSDLSPSDVEDLVAALLVDMHPDASHMDGSGGDGGRDVIWPGPDGLVIFEIKSFCRRLQPKQKDQIKRSLAKALSHDPARWVLVLPLNHSPKEETWFGEVLCDCTDVPLEWWGRTKIETALSARPHIINGFVTSVREAALAAVAEFKQEQALLAGGAEDLRSRVERLQARASAVDADYDLAFASGPGWSELSVLVRTPDALDRRPITASFTVQPPETDEGKAFVAEYRRSFEYGTAVHIPAKYLSSVSLNAPFDLGFEVGTDDDGNPHSSSGMGMPSVELKATENATWQAQGRIIIFDGDEQPVSDVAVEWTGRNAGTRGCQLHGRDRLGRFSFTTVADWPSDGRPAPLKFNLRFHPSPAVTPVEMLEAMSWGDTIQAAHQVHFEVDGQPAFVAGGAPDVAGAQSAGFEGLRPLVEDLACIQQATRPFGLPAELTDEQGALVQLAARLLRERTFAFEISEASLTIELTDPAAFLEDAATRDERMFALDGTLELGFLTPGIEVGILCVFEGQHTESYEDLEAAVRHNPTVRLRIAVTPGTGRYQLRRARSAA